MQLELLPTVQLAVLNPGGNDREQSFPDHAGSPDDAVLHPPVNYHAYAACTAGTFYRDPARIPATQRQVLLIIRRDLKACLRALRQLKTAGCQVAISLKESGLHQVAKTFTSADNLRLFRDLCALADGCIASTPDLVPIYQSAGGRSVTFIPTPYPVDDDRWNFSQPLAQRAGIFIGTREWNTPSRNHAAALLLASKLAVPVTVINEDGRAGRKRLAAVGIPALQVIEGRLPYPDYLRLIATHRIVLQLDRSAVPGQVAGDALLCGLPCVGGDGAIDTLAHKKSAGPSLSPAQLRDIATNLLQSDSAHASAVKSSRDLALQHLSYKIIAQSLTDYFSGLPQ
jgi:hypothetical protein